MAADDPARSRPGRRAPADRGQVAARMLASPVSHYQLAELLGVHVSDLDDAVVPRLPVSVLIELCRQAELHPADLVPELEPTLTLPRLPAGDDTPPENEDVHRDAHVILAALSTARGPLSPGTIADVLGWSLERAHDALDLIANEPDLPAPLALHRTPRGTYQLAPRPDLLGPEQRERINTAADLDAYDFPDSHLELLVAAIVYGRTERYASIKVDNWHAHKELTELGLLLPVAGEHDQVEVHPDIAYSLTGCQEQDRGINQPAHIALAADRRY